MKKNMKKNMATLEKKMKKFEKRGGEKILNSGMVYLGSKN